MFSKIKNYYHTWQAYKLDIKEKNSCLYFVIDIVEGLAYAVIVVLVIIRPFIVQVSVVPSPSMEPTLMVKDRLIVNKFIYRFTTPHRGDIVIFKSPFKDGKDYVKRCIGIPGDTLRIVDGDVYINNKLLIVPGTNIQFDTFNFSQITIPEEHYFVMGDNRANSYDSRFWGLVPKKDIIGQALITFWPVTRMRPLR
jgi:signal peptidase I